MFNEFNAQCLIMHSSCSNVPKSENFRIEFFNIVNKRTRNYTKAKPWQLSVFCIQEATHEEHDVNLPPPNTLVTSIQCKFLCFRFIVLQLQYILAIKCNLASRNVLFQVINTLNDLLHDMAINA